MNRILNNNKALIFIIAVLLIANIAMLIFFVGMRPPGPGGRDGHGGKGGRVKEKVTNFLRQEIAFNETQLKQFDSLRNEHWKELKPMIKSMNAIKDNFYSHLSDATIDSTLFKATSDSIATKQKSLDSLVFLHFRDIRLLCTPDQIPKYDSMVQDVIRNIVSPYRKKGK